MKRQLLALSAPFILATALQADITLSTQAPPQADPQAAQVSRGGQTKISLRGHQGGGGTLTFSIVQPPEHGKLSQLQLIGENRASIAYKNDGLESVNSDRFRYVVKTNGGRTSSPAEVRIAVEEVPPRMVVPGKIEFDEIMAGESESRSLAITNEGGGTLEGRLTISAPWQLAWTDYRVKSGQTETIPVRFQPDEGRQFVGQITLADVDGAQTSLQLTGAAAAPVRADPDHLEIGASNGENGWRVGFVSLTNQTERVLQLKLDAGSNIQTLPEITLAPHEKKKVPIFVPAQLEVALHEEIAFVAAGFKVPLRVDAAATSLPLMESNREPVSPERSPTALPSATAAAAARVLTTESHGITIPGGASPSSTVPGVASVALHARRVNELRWELRWPQSKTPVAKYRAEERLLSLDGAGALQTSWRELTPLETAAFGNEIVAQIKGLESKQLHMLRVTAIGAAGATLWESPVVALAPPAEPARREHAWLVFLGLTLLTFVFIRWRFNRAPA